jgi:glucose/mannose-6-phosphate isomerase
MAYEEKFKSVKDTIQKYPDQLKQSWEEVRGIHLPTEYKSVQNIVYCGMGGSALGARMVDSLFRDRLNIPLQIVNDYRIPSYVDDKTLVIVASYSGTTEETLASLEDATRKRAKIFGIASGGPLAEKLESANLPCYIFDPKNNPSKQPRMSLGYFVGTFIAILTSLGFVELKDDEIYGAISVMQEAVKHYMNETDAENTAYNLAQTLNGKLPVLVASEHLVGVAHAVKNQFNESAKTFATLFELPELNHHLMEGLAHPKENKDLLHFVFINSHLYSPKIQKRYPLTQEVVGKNEIQHSMFSPTATDKLAQVFETLVFGSCVVYYVTKEYGIDPTEIPWVDYFKKVLAKA